MNTDQLSQTLAPTPPRRACSRSKLSALLLTLLLSVFPSAEATTLSLDTGKSLNLQPNASGNFTLSFTNSTGDITSNFLAWTMGIQVQPVGSVSGIVTPGTLAHSVENPMPIGAFPDIIQPTLLTLANSATINGSTNFYQIGMQTTVALGTVLSGTSYNMGTLSFTASSGAAGTWNVYAVQQGGVSYQTFWTNGSLNDIDFGNLPRSAGNSSLLLGTITVAPLNPPATHWKGQTNSTWSGTNWASDASGTATTSKPTSTSDITLSATGAQNQTPITLDVDATINSLLTNLLLHQGLE